VANALYPLGRQKFLEGGIAFLTDDIRVVLLEATYTYSDAHEFHDDLTNIVDTSANLTGKDSTGGVADATDVTFPSVTGPTATQVVVYKWTGVSATSPLIAFYDSDTSAVMLSVTPDGSNIVLRWSDGPLKMFRL
jgi:hypothetical protein